VYVDEKLRFVDEIFGVEENDELNFPVGNGDWGVVKSRVIVGWELGDKVEEFWKYNCCGLENCFEVDL